MFKRPVFAVLMMVWLGLLLGFAFAEPAPRAEPVPLSWVGEALEGMPFILAGRR